MKRLASKDFVELLEQAGYEPQSYSGRCMYGARCVSVNIDRGVSAAKVAAEVMREAVSQTLDNAPDDMIADELTDRIDALASVLSETREDSMGLGGVVYWPDVKWEKSDDEEPADEEADDVR